MIDRTDSGGWTYGLCPKCGKPYVYTGDVPPGGFIKGSEPYCTCNENKYNLNEDLENLYVFNNLGWVCPKCGKVFSPDIYECKYCNSLKITTNLSSTDTLTFDEKDDI